METKDYVHSFSPSEIWYSPGTNGNVSEARQYFWDEKQMIIMQELQKEFDNGWKPITMVSPAGFKLREYEKTETIPPKIELWEVLLWIISFGLMFIISLISGSLSSKNTKRTIYEPTEFRVMLQR